MAITTLLDPALLPARTMDQDTFNAAMAYLMTNLPTWGAQTNAIQANLNSIAAGGAYAIPYTFSTGAVAATTGMCSVDNAPAPAHVYLNRSLASGSVDAILQTFDDSTSVLKGTLRLVKQTDATKWMVLSVTSLTTYTGYVDLAVTSIQSSSGTASPFANNDPVLVYFQRTGDRGDVGSSQALLLRELYSSGSNGPSLTASAWNMRVLNTVAWNGITGASLGTGGANTFRLPVGLYTILASAPAVNLTAGGVIRHQLRLFNRSGGATYDIGGAEAVNNYASGGYAGVRAMLRTVLQTSAPTDFSLDHYVSSASTGGLPATTGLGEVCAELLIVKIA